MIKLYLDIDGVLLHKNGSIPAGAPEFLGFVVSHFECHWLTTHCKGDSKSAVKYLMRYYPSEYEKILASIRPTTWDAMKTEGIDFSSVFYWIDDHPFESEQRTLRVKGVSDSLIVVNLSDPNELNRVLHILKKHPAF
jgi:hypothetical protein